MSWQGDFSLVLEPTAKDQAPTAAILDSWVSLYNSTGVDISAGTVDLVMAIGRPANAIDFQSIDGKPVSIIWLLSSPPDKTSSHIHALARISRLMTIDKFRHSLLAAKTGDEVANHFGWFAGFATMDMAASSEWTRKVLGWTPTHPGLLDDIAHAGYCD